MKNGTAFNEQAKLINISRGGFIFTPIEQKTHPYHEGQVIEADIMLPGPPAIQGKMCIKGKINRLSLTKNNPNEKKEQLLISVQFLDHFKFFRAETDSPENIISRNSDQDR